MNFRNKQKGQAFSTFQLLIAAVVALALLGVLMPIIMNALGFAQGDPVTTSKQLLQSQVDNPGSLIFTDPVAFSKSKASLAARGLTQDTGLDITQVVFHDNGMDNKFTATNNTLRYNKSDTKQYIIGILCEVGAENLEALIEDDYSDAIEGSVDLSGLSDEDITVCVVFPKTA